MAAPTPVSAYLHSATMVKAGVFLLARLYPVLGGSALFELLVAGVGLATMLFAAYVAVFKHDLKGLLAYSTISHLGLITFLIGLDSPLSAVAAVFHILNHATFKAALFMTAGIIDHETGTRDMRRLAGLWRLMPWTATLAMIAAAAMAGVPLFNGFLSKEMMFDESLRSRIGPLGSSTWWCWWCWRPPARWPIRCASSTTCSSTAKPRDLPKPHPHEPPLFMKLPVGLLAVACLLVGVLPALTLGPLVHVAADGPARRRAAAVPAGDLAWLQRPADDESGGPGLRRGLVLRAAARLQAAPASPAGLDRRAGLHPCRRRPACRWPAASPAALESGSLQCYLAWMLAAALLLAALPFLLGRRWRRAPATRARLPAPPLALAVWLLLIAVGAALLRLQRQRYVAVVLTGAVGLVASHHLHRAVGAGPGADPTVGGRRVHRAAADGPGTAAAGLAARIPRRGAGAMPGWSRSAGWAWPGSAG